MALAAILPAQPIEAREAVAKALARSATVGVANQALAAKQATLRGVRSPLPVVAELAPGVGFTNSNFVLSREFDLFGRQKALAQVAESDVKIAELNVNRIRTGVIGDVLTAITNVIFANEEYAAATRAQAFAKDLKVAVTKLNEIGEAPKVHVTRAELELLRADQQVRAANKLLIESQLAYGNLVGVEARSSQFAWPKLGSAPAKTTVDSFDLREAVLALQGATARIVAARSDLRPRVSAGIAADVWSLDRRPAQSRNLGLQVGVRIPLGGDGRSKQDVKAREADLKGAEARVEQANREALLKRDQASAAYSAASTIAASFTEDVLPRANEMLTSILNGYTSKLVTQLEVIEAQRTRNLLERERNLAQQGLRLAELELWRTNMMLSQLEANR